MTLQWYALRSKPRKEDAVWRQVSAIGYEVFYPRIRVQPVNPRARRVRPYFPGYLFVRANLEEAGISTFQWMTHTVGLVSFGGEPAPVPDTLITALQKRVSELDLQGGETLENIRSGEEIHIRYGPFQGYEAIFDVKLPGLERVRVLLKILGDRYVPLEIAASHVARKGERYGAREF